MTGSQNAARSYAKKRLAVVLLGGVIGVAIGLAGVYGIGHLAGNAGADPACKAANPVYPRKPDCHADDAPQKDHGQPFFGVASRSVLRPCHDW